MNTTRSSASRDAAYRHLITVILRLDVASLANDLRSARLAPITLPRVNLPKAA